MPPPEPGRRHCPHPPPGAPAWPAVAPLGRRTPSAYPFWPGAAPSLRGAALASTPRPIGPWGLVCLGGGLRCGVAWNALFPALLVGVGSTVLGLAFALVAAGPLVHRRLRRRRQRGDRGADGAGWRAGGAARLAVDLPHGGERQRAVKVAIRPETLLLAPECPSHPALAGRVVKASPLGGHMEYTVATALGDPLRHRPGRDPAGPSDTSVWLTLAHHGATVVPSSAT